MDVVEIFGQFRKDVFPDEEVEVKISEVVAEFESFLPQIVKIIQKDVTFFDEERLVFGRNISKVDNREAVWKNLVPCMIASFMRGDIRKKVGKISEIIKNVWNASGQENDLSNFYLERREIRRKISGDLGFYYEFTFS